MEEGRMVTEDGPVILPDVALEHLKQGNERFALDNSTHFHTDADRRVRTLKDGQRPFATVLACSDSRVPVEIIFDQGIGDIFVVRVAGNVCNRDEMGCIEYAVGHLKTPLVVVLGHTDCGAVTAVATGAEMHGNIPPLVSNIHLALSKVKRQSQEISGDELVSAAIVANVWQSIEDLFRGSYPVRELVGSGKLMVVGAVYDLETGRVEWIGEHPNQDSRFVERRLVRQR
jgi:carbonic anhydrase